MINLTILNNDEFLKLKSSSNEEIIFEIYKIKKFLGLTFLKKQKEISINPTASTILDEFQSHCMSGFYENRMADYEQDLLHVGIGLTEECGELAGIIKKTVCHSMPLDKPKAKSELGDILWYWMAAVSLFGFTPKEVITYNVLKLKERYPNGRSVNYQKRNKENFKKLDEQSKTQ